MQVEKAPRFYKFRMYWPPSKRAWRNFRFRVGFWIGDFKSATAKDTKDAKA